MFAAGIGESGYKSVFVNKVLLENPAYPLTYDNLPFTHNTDHSGGLPIPKQMPT